jgi:hypothetical protein
MAVRSYWSACCIEVGDSACAELTPRAITISNTRLRDGEQFVLLATDERGATEQAGQIFPEGRAFLCSCSPTKAGPQSWTDLRGWQVVSVVVMVQSVVKPLVRFCSGPDGQGTLATSWPTAVKLLNRYQRYILNKFAVLICLGNALLSVGPKGETPHWNPVE